MAELNDEFLEAFVSGKPQLINHGTTLYRLATRVELIAFHPQL
jgi:hypothetical protein